MKSKEQMKNRLKHLEAASIRVEVLRQEGRRQERKESEEHLEKLYKDTYKHYPVKAYSLRQYVEEIQGFYKNFKGNDLKRRYQTIALSRSIFIDKETRIDLENYEVYNI